MRFTEKQHNFMRCKEAVARRKYDTYKHTHAGKEHERVSDYARECERESEKE